MPDALRVRNFTSQPLVLKLVERHEPPQPGAFANFSRNVTSLVSSSPTSPSPDAAFTRDAELDITIAPFTTATTDIRPAGPSPASVLRLTLETAGQSYRVDTYATPRPGSALIPLSNPDAAQSFTGVYVPSVPLLAIYPTYHPADWMSHLSDALPLSALSIPGTHNSPTHHRALPSVRCQSVPVRAQLDAGVRFLDVRVQPVAPNDPANDTLHLVHGVFPISLTGPKAFRPLLDELYGFLAAHPAETLLLSLKREGPGSATDHQLSAILATHYADDRLLTGAGVPRLGAARGKIVLVRRFEAASSDAPQGIDAAGWAYNTALDRRGAVAVQDYCEVLEPDSVRAKIGYCCDHLGRAGETCCLPDDDHQNQEHAPLWLNFLSASNFWHVGCWPEKIARQMNPAVVKYLCVEHGTGVGDGGAGVVVCDWVGEDGDWDLVTCIVGCNARLAVKFPRS